MKKRGELIRNTVPDALRGLLGSIRSGIADLKISGRDGVGFKNRIPFVRLYSASQSPRSTSGLYLVFLFSFDGSAVFLSLNQGVIGSVNRSKPPDKIALAKKVEGLRGRLRSERVEISGLEEVITLNDPGDKGAPYEAGNIFAIKYSRAGIPHDEHIANDLARMLGLLSILYSPISTPAAQNAAYLLTWNPQKWSWSDLSEAAKNLSNGLQPKSGQNGARWSVKNYGIKPGDSLYISRVGTEPKGIIGSGKATSFVYEAPHFSGNESKTAHYVDIEWDVLLDPHLKPPLSVSELKRNVSPKYKWTPQASGLVIPGDVFQKLEIEWNKHHAKGGTGVTGTPADFAPFTKADALNDLFLTEAQLDLILGRLKRKKALILQGPPGVGKTFIARRLAFALMNAHDERRVAMVQFHPSYGYEDFVQGFRPTGSGLQRCDGIFYKFACLARDDPSRDWVFIIDEINRGNLAKIFGELLVLIEADKRGRAHAIPLTYSKTLEETFYLPDNLYFIGTMNTADRSLAMVDFALRRRFGFVTLEPAFESTAFSEWLKKRLASDEMIAQIRNKVRALNDVIEKERDLGPGFCIGHSFFCPIDGHPPNETWYDEVVDGEIKPLLEEYFDSRDRVKKLVDDLLTR